MERAPARWGPSINALLRDFNEDPVTVAFSSAGFLKRSFAIPSPKKLEAIILVLMMASKPLSGAVLGGHHRCVAPRTMTGIIRTTTLINMPCKNDAEPGRSFEMATVSITNRHEDNRMGARKSISQINTSVNRNKYGLCRKPLEFANRADFIVARHTFSAREASKIKTLRFTRLRAGHLRSEAYGCSFLCAHNVWSQVHRRSLQGPP